MLSRLSFKGQLEFKKVRLITVEIRTAEMLFVIVTEKCEPEEFVHVEDDNDCPCYENEEVDVEADPLDVGECSLQNETAVQAQQGYAQGLATTSSFMDTQQAPEPDPVDDYEEPSEDKGLGLGK